MAYRAHILNSAKALVATLQDAVWEYTESLNAEDRLTLETPESDKWAYLTADGSFVRLIDDITATDKRTYRIQSVQEVHEQGRKGIRVEGDRIWQDMAREVYAGHHPYQGAQLKDIFADLMAESQFVVKAGGTAASDTTEIDYLDLSYLTILDAVQQLAEAAGYEIEIDESTSPEGIDLKARGASNGVDLTYSVNVPSVKRVEKRDGIANKVYPLGGGDPPATCKGARFEVLSCVGGLITVKGDKCIPSDDCYNTNYKVYFFTGAEAGNSYAIADCARGATADADLIGQAGNPSAGDIFCILDSTGAQIDYVPDTASIASYGTFEQVVRDTSYESVTTLLLHSGFMDGTYVGGVHEGWSATVTPTCSEETDTDYIEHGAASQKVIADAAGDGIVYTVTLDGSDYYSLSVRMYVTSGSVQVRVTGDDGEDYYNGSGTTGTGWQTWDITGMQIGGATATIWLRALGGAATFYVDAVMFSPTQQIAQFSRYSGSRDLYRAAFDYLDKHKNPILEYEVGDALDLYRTDPVRWPFQSIEIGDTVRVVDPEFSIGDSVRVISITRNQSRETLRLKLASQTDFSAVMAAISPGSAQAIKVQRELTAAQKDVKALQQSAVSLSNAMLNANPQTARSHQYTGALTATGQTSVNFSAGTIRRGDQAEFTLGGNGIAGLVADTVYYLYFDPGDAASEIQATTSFATATARDVIFMAIAVTGATAYDRVRIMEAQRFNEGEIWAKGLEVYDDTGTKRVDIGLLQDSTIANPSDLGFQIDDGPIWQVASVGGYGGAFSVAWRCIVATHDTAENSTGALYADYIAFEAKTTQFGMTGSRVGVTAAAGSTGYVKGIAVDVTNSGSGAATGIEIDGLSAVGNAIGISVSDVTSSGGSAYNIYTGGANWFNSRSLAIGGIAYTWPADNGDANEFLMTDGAGNLTWEIPGAAVDHGTLLGLADDDHTQYALLAGRAGGQTLYGGNAANDDITIAGTSHGTVATSYVILQPSGGYVVVNSSTPTGYLTLSQDHNSALGWDSYGLHVSGVTANTKRIQVGIETTSNFGWIRAVNAGVGYLALALQPDGGKVGIGTTAPYSVLSVCGAGVDIGTGNDFIHSLFLQDQTNYRGIYLGYNQTTTGGLIFGGAGGDIRFWGYSGAAWGERVRITAAGNVGTGTTTPDTLLHVHVATAGAVTAAVAGVTIESNDDVALNFLVPNNKSSKIVFGDADDNDVGYLYYNHATGIMGVIVETVASWYSTSTAMVSNLNFGVGVSPSYNLHVYGADSTAATVETASTSFAGLAILYLYKSGTPTDNSTFQGVVYFKGKDQAGNAETYGSVACLTTNTGNGTEASYLSLQANAAGSAVEAFRAYGTGNCMFAANSANYGILAAGTATWNTKLMCASATASGLFLCDNAGNIEGGAIYGTGASVGFLSSAAAWAYEISTATGHYWSISGTQHMTLLSTGLGINISPLYDLHVYDAATTNATLECATTDSTNLTLYLMFYKSGTPVADSTLQGAIVFQGKDQSGNAEIYGRIRCDTTNTTNGTEAAYISLWGCATESTRHYSDGTVAANVDGAGGGTIQEFDEYDDALEAGEVIAMCYRKPGARVSPMIRAAMFDESNGRFLKIQPFLGLLGRAQYQHRQAILSLHETVETHAQKIARLEHDNAALRAKVARLELAA